MAKFQPTPRAFRDDGMLDLDDQLDHLRAIAEALKEIGAHLAHVNRLRYSAGQSFRTAQEVEDEKAKAPAGEHPRRRRSDSVVQMMQAAAEAETAGTWAPSQVAA